MANIINSALKTKVSNAFRDLHDSFAREGIVAYKTATTTLIATNPTYNSIYGRGTSLPNETQTVVSMTLNARIYYGEINEILFAPSNSAFGEQSKVKIPNGSALLIVDEAGYDFMKDAKRVEVDGKIFSVSSDNTPMGMFERTHHEFLLTPIDT